MLDKDKDSSLDTDLDLEAGELEDGIDNQDIDDQDHDADENGVIALTEPHTILTSESGATPLDLARLGLRELAYIRRALVNDVPMWTIHSAAGVPLGAAQSFDQAWAAVRQNDLEPVRVH